MEQNGIEQLCNSDNLLFNNTIKELKRNKKLREEGKHISIPFGFPRLDKVFPGITKATYYLVSANQKVGKSMITNGLFILNALDFIQTKNTNLDIRVFSFNLEMSKEALMRQIISYRLYKKHKVRLNPRQLQSLYEDYILPDEILRFIDEDRDWFDFFSSKITFIDEIKNPTGIYKFMREYAYENGVFYDKENNIIPIDKIRENDEEINFSIDRYEQNNPDLIVLPIVDNINLFKQEKQYGSNLLMSPKETMAKYSGDYCIKLRNRFGMSPVNIQQQAAVNESVDGAKLDMKEPSSANLAEHKGTTRDVDVFITLHSPFRAKQEKYAGYDIKILRDNFRNFKIDLDRNGQSCETNLFFDGAVNLFKELPPSNSAEILTVYEKIKKLNL